MPGTLKLNAVASIYYNSHKPYNWFRSFTSVTGTGTSNSPVAAHTRCSWCGTSIPAYGDSRSRRKFLRRLGDGYADFAVRSISTTQMGPTPDHKEEDLRREKPSLPPKSEKLLTLPTILTIGRVAAVPLLVTTFYVDSWWGPTATTAIFIAAAVTDWLDGYLARKMNLGTAFGAFLDPVADKLMVAATLVLLCTKPLESGVFGQFPWLLTVPSIAIIGREITMSAVREWAASQGGKLSEAVAVNNLGKWKTTTQMIALTILLLTRDSSLSVSGSLVGSGVTLLYISAWLAVWSLVVYMRKIWKVLLM
ncbi:CDP-diacylglycerol--glycerol-3-phosphate 3-phosphatidyltransferase 2-like [Solanum dulcamara]|uniref:CDP-diacylglycerol--glycerol-3-phosphate 3-phosphatidyltransferase 2-like n=1 Tax=Solanum dulcamara TaxID=45834 RepID=UPI0024858EFC|nr:CDP-diacylglycerol--glycerol-3-phosphate 3-phosphatidyltransferase 2-like [Solanum dulcamara]